MKRKLFIASTFVALLLVASCTPKVKATPFTEPAKASDDIATSIKLFTAAESNLEKQKLITPQEGLAIINGLSALNSANIQFNSDLSAAKASGNKSALKPSLDALKKAAVDLNTNGVLGIKSPEAKQAFQLTVQSLNLALGVLEGFVTSQ